MKSYQYDSTFIAVRKGIRGFFRTNKVDDSTTICDKTLPVCNSMTECLINLTGALGKSSPVILDIKTTIQGSVRIYGTKTIIKYIKSESVIDVDGEKCKQFILVGNNHDIYTYTFNSSYTIQTLRKYQYKHTSVKKLKSLSKPMRKPQQEVFTGLDMQAKVIKLKNSVWDPDYRRLKVSYYTERNEKVASATSA